MLTSATAANLFKPFQGKVNWQFCGGVYIDEAAAMTGRLPGFTTRVKQDTSECDSTHCVIYRVILTIPKMSPELNNDLDDVIKVINYAKLSVHAVLCGAHTSSLIHKSKIAS